MDTNFNILKEDLNNVVNLYSKQQSIVGIITKYRFNHLDFGLLLQSALLSLDNDFEEKYLIYKGVQVRTLRVVNEIVLDVASSTIALKDCDSLISLTYEVSQGYHKYILHDKLDNFVHDGDFYKNVKNKEDKSVFFSLKKNDQGLSLPFKLGLKAKLEMSNVQIGMIVTAICQSSINQSYIQEHKNEKYLRKSLLSLSSLYKNL